MVRSSEDITKLGQALRREANIRLGCGPSQRGRRLMTLGLRTLGARPAGAALGLRMLGIALRSTAETQRIDRSVSAKQACGAERGPDVGIARSSTCRAWRRWIAPKDVDVVRKPAPGHVGLMVVAPTIQVVEHRTATEFLRAAESVLGRAEVEHALLLGIAIASAAAEPTHVDERTRWLTARRDEETLAAAMWSAPFRPVLSNGPIDVATVFARWFLATAPDLAGVSGPAEHCLAFMRAWRAGGGPGMRRMIRMGIHELNEVDWLAVGKTPTSGQLRRANAGDVGTIIAWTRAFYEEVQLGGDPPPDESSIAQKVTSGRIFVWDHGGPVSMAGAARPTRRGVTVNLVYTPSQHRGKGHATACVAHLSAQLLERHAFCTLFTDLANPTSNAIYKRIGYRPVADFDVWLR